MHIPKHKDIETVKNFSDTYRLTTYAVGGCVRDTLLGREPKDLDFLVVTDSPKHFSEMIKQLSDTLNLHIIVPSSFQNVVRLVSREKCLDFTQVSSSDMESDLLRRDFTINTLAADLRTNTLMDLTGAENDLKNKCLKAVSQQSFTDDPVRIIRLARFSSQLGFSIDKNTLALSRKASSQIRECAGERVAEELFAVLKNTNGFNAIKELFVHHFDTMFPAFKKIRGIPQNGYHHLNVEDHTLSVVELTFNTKELFKFFPGFSFELSDVDLISLRMAALFHDVGKGCTLAYNDKGMTTFRNHQYRSSELFKSDTEWMHLSKEFTERVFMLIRRHMLFLNFMLNGHSEKSFRKFINMMRSDTILLLLLALADKLSAKGPLSEGTLENLIEVGNQFLVSYQKNKDELLHLPKLVDGHEVMEIMSIAPSKEVGDILNTIMEKQLEDPDFTREKALELLCSLKKNTGSSI